ncbi:glycosyltransferase [Tessaracoccus antarcticus]|uniref:Glycosyltransferase n=1 Tax=Tessaracoccus antarcticus TaxID=2479848 RepID=A0A3M0FZP4_9ACTN|nr:glycosyltransferase [Tessaracoccus antarcticus]RMB58144.1 glycosyltransferase [Tessaracoccus antarcticus]
MATCLLVHPGAELFGADRMLLESAIAVRESGMSCLVALPEGGPLVDALEAQGIPTVIVPMLVLRKALLRPRNWLKLLGGWMAGLVSSWKLITRTAPACIYVSTVTLPQWPLVARLRRIPCITHVHEAEGSARRWANLALYIPHLASTSVLVNSHFSLRTIAKSLPMLAERARVVANGVAGPPIAPTLPRRELGGFLRVLYLGRLSPRKGPDLIVEAAKILRGRVELEMVFAGSTFSGYESYESELRSALKEGGYSDEEVLVGFRPEIWPLLEHCDVLVVPSRLDEPFGNTAVEGVLAQRPVIVSDTTGLREAAAGYPSAHLVRRNDPEALAEALQDLVDQWATVRGLVETSARMAQERHDPVAYRRRISDAVAQQLVSLLNTES